jgi:uracil-DNA glycosylase
MNPREFKQKLLEELFNKYENQSPCHLGFNRRNIVFGDGNANAELMFIGEAPGEEEDKQGKPFVGRSGQLLNKALNYVKINREDVYITNVVKCRPPNNRAPLPEEIKICKSLFLEKQIKIIQPKIIATLGSIATNAMLGEAIQITKIHGNVIHKDNLIIIPIYHPAYVLRNQTLLASWIKDFEKIKNELQVLSA